MSKDFNSEMFSAILASNEKTLALLTQQLDNTHKQAKWNEIKFYVTVCVLSLLLGGMIWLYFNKKTEVPELTVNYGQDAVENIVDNNSSIKNVEEN